jgi:hypothetical protein
MFGEENKLWISSLRIFLHPPVTSSLLSPNIHPGTLFSDTLTLVDICNCVWDWTELVAWDCPRTAFDFSPLSSEVVSGFWRMRRITDGSGFCLWHLR